LVDEIGGLCDFGTHHLVVAAAPRWLPTTVEVVGGTAFSFDPRVTNGNCTIPAADAIR